MAIYGSLSTVRSQIPDKSVFRIAFKQLEEYLKNSEALKRLKGLKAGENHRVELGEGVFALEQVYMAKPRAEVHWEAHKLYIDIQMIIEGDEIMEVTDISHLTVEEDKTPAADVLFYKKFEEASVLRVKEGEIGLFYPVDAHLPSVSPDGKPRLNRKVVVKVPVAGLQ